ncbi:MAG: hypothetical protein ACLFVC_01515 [Opitutales bacterium]
MGKNRTALLIGLDLFLLFAVLPLVLLVRTEFDRLKAELAEQAGAVDEGSEEPEVVPEAVAPAPPAATEAGPARSRSVLRPVDVAALPGQLPFEEEEDPFIAEARRRARDNPEAAMLWIQSQSEGQQRLRAMLEVVAVWAAADSENALLWLESNAQGLARLETLYSGIELWGQEDPISAAQWIEGMANDASKVTATKALVTNWVRDDPEGASRWVGEMPDGPVRAEAAEAMVRSWAAYDPKAASMWALTEAEFTGNRGLLTASVAEYAKSAPRQAEQFVREIDSAMGAPEAVRSYVRSLAEQDPERAARWVGGLAADDPLSSPENARVLLEEWSRTDSVAASAWIAEKAPGRERDAAILGFAETMTDFEPEAAAAWSSTLSDPDLRVETLVSTVDRWARTRPSDAREWVESAELEPALREALASRIGAD